MSDSYLDALEAEAESSNNVNSVNNADSAKIKLELDEKSRKKLEFENSLRNTLPATFKSYRMLSEEDKQQVVDVYYESNMSMPVATKFLFSLYFKK